ncbi:hypothetical protein BVX94_03860 [bacterium B17]|nr:hypothetical protein BVX94_03860 [bacterium B17]
MFVRSRGVEPLERPEYMCKHDQGGEHICVATASLLGAILSFLARPKLVLVWKDVSPLFWKLADRLKIKAVNVATDDLSSFEYGRYCDSYWNYLLSPLRRDRLIIESYNRFRNVAEIIRRKGLSSACVCGTGPSLETAYQFDFTGLLTLVCN